MPMNFSKHFVSLTGRILAGALLLSVVAGFVYTSWARETADAAAIASGLAGENGEIRLVPHKAFYKLQMTSSAPMSDVNNVSGEMAFSWNKDCEGWTADHRFNLLYEYTSNPGVRMTSDFSTFEALDGSRFEFVSTKRRDGEIIEHYRGSAELDAKGNGQATYREGDVVTKLPLDAARFPMEHTVEMIRAAREGKKFFTATVFDGSEKDGAIIINGVILDKGANAGVTHVSTALQKSPVEKKAFARNPLLQIPSHLIRLAFFKMGQDSAEPDYEMTVRLYENGIITHMDIDYDTFSVSQSLLALEPVTTPSCPKE
ncbi:MAG: DUF1849 family protein [Pseudobdellovibrionaceae bacterium]